MIAFNFEKQKAWEVLDYFKKYYDLDESSVKELDKNFTEYAKLYESNLANLPTESYEHQDPDKSQLTTLHNFESFLTQNNTESNEETRNNSKSAENEAGKISEIGENANKEPGKSDTKENENRKINVNNNGELNEVSVNVNQKDKIDSDLKSDRVSNRIKIEIENVQGKSEDTNYSDYSGNISNSGKTRNLIVAGRDKDVEKPKENSTAKSEDKAAIEENKENHKESLDY